MGAVVVVGPGLQGIGVAAGNGNGRRRRQLLLLLGGDSSSNGKNGWTELKTKITMELRWIGSGRRGTRRPIYISTKPSDVKPEELLRLYDACNHSCHRFPVEPDPQPQPQPQPLLDIHKLRVALSHSPFLVSVFTKSHSQPESSFQFGDLFQLQRALNPIPIPSDSQLVGFGRAVSDMGLTASIHDVMVMPSLRRMGIGRMIVQRLVRMITSRDIYDISALCSEDERLFFKQCGFGDDILAATTMMYTKTVSTCPEDDQNDQIVTPAGRKLLIAPPLRNLTHSKTIES